MREFLEKSLKQNISIEENTQIFKKLPLVYKGRYTIYNVKTNDNMWIAISPKSETGLVVLRKDRARIEKEANLNCAIFLDKVSYYMKERLLEEGIPFVIKDKQLYLPFVGCSLSNENDRTIAPIHLISYLTQKLIITAIYERWHGVNVTVAAEKMCVTKMSISRAFDELEYLNINILEIKGKSRVIVIPKDVKKLWNQIKGILRNPVIKRFELCEDMKMNINAGISALCEYSLLSDNKYPTYGITKKNITKSGVSKMQRASAYDEIGCIVFELGYFVEFGNKNLQDPLSVSLSLSNEELNDERVSISVNEMLEEYVWSRG